MNTTNVAIVNGISLQVVADDREHPIFGSVIPLRGTTGIVSFNHGAVPHSRIQFSYWAEPNNWSSYLRIKFKEIDYGKKKKEFNPSNYS